MYIHILHELKAYVKFTVNCNNSHPSRTFLFGQMQISLTLNLVPKGYLLCYSTSTNYYSCILKHTVLSPFYTSFLFLMPSMVSIQFKSYEYCILGVKRRAFTSKDYHKYISKGQGAKWCVVRCQQLVLASREN